MESDEAFNFPECPQDGLNFLGMSAALSEHEIYCGKCGKVIAKNKPYRLDRYDTALCADHDVRNCCICGRFIIEDNVKLTGFGRACPHCGSMRNELELSAARRFIEDFYAGLRINIPDFSVSLLSAEQMHQRYGSQLRPTPLGVSSRQGPFHVDLMAQQSPVNMVHTLAHEMLHLWMWQNSLRPPTAYAEGFCNLGAFLVTAKISRNEALVKLFRQMENPDRVYGVAFRELKVVHDVYGWETVVAAVRRWKVSKSVVAK